MRLKDFKEFLDNKGIEYKEKRSLLSQKLLVNYKGLKFLFLEFSLRNYFQGVKISFFFPKPLKLGLYCGYNMEYLSSLSYKYQKDFLTKKIKLPFPEVECWAKKEKIVKEFFSDYSLIESLRNLKDSLKISQQRGGVFTFDSSAFIIKDEFIEVFIDEKAFFEPERILESFYQLVSKFLEILRSRSSEIYQEPASDKIFKGIVIFLIILTFLVLGLVVYVNFKFGLKM